MSLEMDRAVLEQILVLQAAIPAAPDERRLWELVLHGLGSLPGVREVAVCAEGTILREARAVPGGRAEPEVCGEWGTAREGRGCDENCPCFSDREFRRVAVRTIDKDYASLFFAAPSQVAAALTPLVANVANQVALRIEHDRLQRSLENINRTLEQLVQERTADLLARERDLRDALERLSNKEALLSRLLETSPVAIFFVDREGSITFANPRAERLLGVSQAEILERRYDAPAWRITSWDGGPFPDDELPFARVRATREPVFGVRHAIEWPDGSRVLLSINAAPLLDAAGEFDGMVASFEDVTQEVRAQREKAAMEELLRHSQKMEAIGRLAAGVAHDFNNLLTVVLGCAEHLAEHLAEGDPLREDAVEILDAGRRTTEIVRHLLTFSRGRPVRAEPVDVNALLGRMEKLLGRLLGEDIDLRQDLAETLPPIRIDPAQFEQVIVNLAVNARDAMPRGGRLSIVTRLSGEDGPAREGGGDGSAGRAVVIEVADTGRGMPREMLEKIFEPFFTTKDTGSGLGLSTVYGIVRQAGGDITVDSVEGQGTTFRMVFPALAMDALRDLAATAPTVRVRGRGELILLVEDEAPLRNLLARKLQSLGYRVAAAENGGAAVLQVEEKGLRPDLLLSDVVMPVMNGWELCERLRRTLPDLKIIFISGYTEEAIGDRTAMPADVPVLQKPFDFERLSSLLREALEPHVG